MSGAQAALAAAAARLRAAGVPDPARDARLLLAGALEVAPERLSLRLPERMDAGAARRFEASIAGRVARRPVAQLLGRRVFWGREFRVTGDVLDPRPETETLVALALAPGGGRPTGRMLDLGTGTGCLLLTLLAERPGATGLGTDVSRAALAVARDNRDRLGLAARAELAEADWFAGLTGRFDLILANPPYIAAHEMAGLAPEPREWEPRVALSPGPDGLAAYRRIAAGAAGRLAPGGRLLVEVGATQGAEVAALFEGGGLDRVAVHPDLSGHARVVEARLPRR